MANPLRPEQIKELVGNAQQCVKSCVAFRQPRLDEIKRSEDMFQGKTKPALKGRFNIPIPILEGFVETLRSKIDDTVRVAFKKSRESTLKAARKVTAAWEKDSGPDRGSYNDADLDTKAFATFSGIGAFKLIPHSRPYRQDLDAVDYHDLIFEPLGGRDLEKHLFKGQLNIFKTREDLKEGAERRTYLTDGVSDLINHAGTEQLKKYRDEHQNKLNRFRAMKLNPEMYSYVGSDVYNLTELVIRFHGEDFYLLFEEEMGMAVRVERLKDMFHSGLSPYVAWHTSRDPVNFLCRAPVDGVRPAAEAIRILINQNFDNIQKRNWDQILVNTRKIKDLAELEYRPHGIIRVNLEQGESMANAYEKMQTPDTSSVTVNLVEWFNNFIGEKSGVTSATQGVADEDKVGIYYGNIQQVADRLGMQNKFYKQAHIEIAKRYKANLAQFMPPRGFMVKFIGLKGVQDEALEKKEAEENLDVNVTSESAEAQMDTMKQEKRTKGLDMILRDENLRMTVSDKWLVDQILRNSEYSEEDIKFALEKEEGANAELLSEAAKAIEEIVAGEEPEVKLNRGANLAFIKKIRDYAYDESDSLEDDIFGRLVLYATAHLEIAMQNEEEEKRMMAQAQGIPPLTPAPAEQPQMPQLPINQPAMAQPNEQRAIA